MYLVDLLQLLLNAQACPSPGTNPDLPASAFSAIGAAFATQGYWVQADLIDYLTLTNMGVWAPLLYVIAAAGGLLSLAMGLPPKMYLWFFVGPAVYSWLLDTRVETFGVRWTLPCLTAQQQETLQRQVWRYAEVGLVNTNMARRMGNAGISRNAQPDEPVRVSLLFLWFDDLISGTILALVEWTGIYSLRSSQTDDTNVTMNLDPSVTRPFWYLLADSKWGLLEQITSARLSSPNLRDAFAGFFVSECGDILRRSLEPHALTIATNSRGRTLPGSVFDVPPGLINTTLNFATEYPGLRERLYAQSVPFSARLRSTLRDSGVGSFSRSMDPRDKSTNAQWQEFRVGDVIRCDSYLYLLIEGFRWEAGHIFHQLVTTVAPEVVRPDELVTTFLYGWDIRRGRETDPAQPVTNVVGDLLEPDEQANFVKDMILLYMFRNEFLTAPTALGPVRAYSNADKVTRNVRAQQRVVGGKSKYGELYAWSLMIPYIQGAFLYLLAMLYPFACVLVVVPGWHKAILTWMSFWAWVKLWDLGFAIVRSIERNVWAMIGNSTDAARVNDRIARMQNFGWVSVSCNPDSFAAIPTEPCPIPAVRLMAPNSSQIVDLTIAGGMSWARSLEAFQIFDHAIVLGSNLDLDLANSYYIFIMAALYYAVPTVTGQMVLGARSGASRLVQQMTSSVMQDASRGVSSAVNGELTGILKANNKSMQAGAFYTALRGSGATARALNQGIARAEQGRLGAAQQTLAGHIGAMAAASNNAHDMVNTAAAGVGREIGRYALDPQKALNYNLGRTFKDRGTAVTGQLNSLGGLGRDRPGGGIRAPDAVFPDRRGTNFFGGGGTGGAGGPGGGPGGGAGGASAALGEVAKRIGGPLGGALSVAGGLKDVAAGSIFAADSLGEYGRMARAAEAENRYYATRAALETTAFGAKQADAQLKNAKDNTREAAKFEAQMASLSQGNHFSTEMGGMAAAMGGWPGTFDAGTLLPTNIKGGAAMGHLGTAAKKSAWHFDPERGSFGQGTERWMGTLGAFGVRKDGQPGLIEKAFNQNTLNPGQILGGSLTAHGKMNEAFKLPDKIPVPLFGEVKVTGWSPSDTDGIRDLSWYGAEALSRTRGTDAPVFKPK